MASLEDIRLLQNQVDALAGRLDFIAPKLSLLSLTLQSSQKVESEALVQLMRMKSAKVGHVAPNVDVVADLSSPVVLARWLHVITDVVLALFARSHQPGARDPSERRTPSRQRTASEVRASINPRRSSGGDAPNSARERSTSPAVYMFSPKKVVNAGSFSPRSTEQCFQEHESGTPRKQLRHRLEAASAHPNLGSQGSSRADMDTTLDRQGLVLGNGAWASAYRKSTGARREALRILGSTGIVTERELADDLTEIGQDHIEECISIAMEMLAKWPPQYGPVPRAEGKAFFEKRLAELYLGRASST
jgi:hypothetical protein